MHRFPNGPVTRPDGLHWDVLGAAPRSARRAALAAAAPDPLAASASTRGRSTTGCCRGGRAARHAVRLPRRAAPTGCAARCTPGSTPRSCTPRTGLQLLPFNTIYQLVAAGPRLEQAADAAAAAGPAGLLAHRRDRGRADERLDHRAVRRAGPRVGRRARSTGSGSPRPDPAAARSTRARSSAHVLPTVARSASPGVPVIAVGSHDTASAVVAFRADGDGVGVHLLGHLVAGRARARRAGADRGGAAGRLHQRGRRRRTVRFLKNVMGLWVLSESMRSVGAGSPTDLSGLLEQAAAYDALRTVVFDINDPSFAAARRHARPDRSAWCREHDGAGARGRLPSSCAASSTAWPLAFAARGEAAATLAGRDVRRVHVVGGGAQNDLLCQLTADRARAAGARRPGRGDGARQRAGAGSRARASCRAVSKRCAALVAYRTGTTPIRLVHERARRSRGAR